VIASPKTFPIPDRMRHLRRDARGFPIFYMAYCDAQGDPHFTVNEEEQRQDCIRREVCSICGGKLMRGRWFLGGPGSAFHQRGCYIDPPMHFECMRYALHVCPYLAMPRWTKFIEGKTLKATDPTQTLIDPAVEDERPEVFVAVMATGQHQIKGGLGYDKVPVAIEFVQYIKPARPYSRLEFWQHGARVDYATALTLMRDDHLQALGEYMAKHGPIRRKVA
jgi:hypothetical protein